MQILHVLGINWTLLIGQMINFAIIAFILAKLVYKPLLKVIDERREATKKAMQHADFVEQKRRELEEEEKRRLREMDEKAGEMMAKAKQEVAALHAELSENARKEAEQIVRQGRKLIEDERNEAIRTLEASLSDSIIKMTEKILEREFSDTDQKRILEKVEQELPALLK